MREPQTAVSKMMTFLLLLFTNIVTSYRPVEHFAVNCGSSVNVLSNDLRNWTGDFGNNLVSLIYSNKATQSIKPDVQVAFNTSIPYENATISRSEFSYSFFVTDGQKFIRLHFYPSSYGPNFLRSDAIFSVKAGPHTLLKDFNASLTADAGTSLHFAEPDGVIVREYIVNVDPGQTLVITFTPSSSHPNAYAFVNGIQVISMPSFLYYTNTQNMQTMMLDGGTQQFPVMNNSALETLYRIDVAGSQIPPEKDTGMFRYWESDNDYLQVERPRSISTLFGLNLTYIDDQNYFAPDAVYKTARNYGMSEKSKFNVTWEFEVDSVFHYMVRLHFCEFDEHIQKVGDRVFQIFINDILVEPIADVMIWTQKIFVPVHRDYAVSMPMDGKKLNLSIKLQPHPYARSTYRDVLLNGIEILKISDFNGDNLGGFNAEQPVSTSLLQHVKRNNLPKMRLVFIVIGSASGFIILLSLFVLLTYSPSTRAAINRANPKWWLQLMSKSKANKFANQTSNQCVGGFGNVYKGQIDNGSVPVAIKRLKKGSQQGLQEFQSEIEILSELRHHHLVSLIGYCNDNNEMILVYEFMARGTFCEHLYDSKNQPISWNQRLEICLGAARGLHYLHTGAKHAIIHRDVKSTNILIDENWMAKISDFGLSKLGPVGISRCNINISTAVKGSIGYLDPEYYTLQILTDKSDVYSFGVVLLEALCGRPPILRAVERERQNLVEWFQKRANENEVYESLKESMTPECLKGYTEIALKCLANNGNDRPSMGDVMLGLESLVEMLDKSV